ncbi:hypothetical protein AMTR_s00039p00097850, partial [Amborella trichopoda]
VQDLVSISKLVLAHSRTQIIPSLSLFTSDSACGASHWFPSNPLVLIHLHDWNLVGTLCIMSMALNLFNRLLRLRDSSMSPSLEHNLPFLPACFLGNPFMIETVLILDDVNQEERRKQSNNVMAIL